MPMPTDGEYFTAKYFSGVVINVIFSKIQRLLMLPGRVFHSLMPRLDVTATCHACVPWEETPRVFLQILTGAC